MTSFGAAPRWPASTVIADAERLERGEVLTWERCPISGPAPEDRAFLFEQRLDDQAAHIGYDPEQRHVYGFARHNSAQLERLRDILVRCAEQATDWLTNWNPHYAAAAKLSWVAFHPDEEATRKLSQLERNDLLHVDAAPANCTSGRLLHFYVNLHPTDVRVWQTSLTLAELIGQYGDTVGLTASSVRPWWRPFRHGLLRLIQPAQVDSEPCNDFMRRLHNYLKTNDDFPERAPKKCWRFPPDSGWVVFADGISHAELRGRFVLEFAFAVAEQGLACPEWSPKSQFERACAQRQNRDAA